MIKKAKFAPEHKNVSRVPNGGYTLTSGSNYMLDGFQFDTEYNGGVLEKARLPEAKGLSALPSGMIPMDSPLFSDIPSHTDEEGGVHLGDFMKEANDQVVPIVDHSWLAQEAKENLSGARSKKDIYEEMDEGFYSDSNLKELESAWGSSTTGLDLVPNENRKHTKYTNPERDVDSLPGDDYRANIEKAMRRSAYGEPLKNILTDLKSEMRSKYRESIGDKIASEHGLHGKVYIREEAFPGLFNGKWDSVIKKRCASAMYIIPNAQDCAYPYHQNRMVVNSINWKKAFNTYAPKLKTIGIKLGSGENYKQRLKQAFLTTPPAPIAPETWFEYQEDLTKRYTTEEAQEQLEDYIPEEETYESLEEKEARLLLAKLETTATQIVKAGLLNKKEASQILNSKYSTSKKMNLLFKFASTSNIKDSNYQGAGVGVITMSTKIATDFSDVKIDTPEHRELKQRIANADVKIQKLIASGLISEKKANKIACGCGSSQPEDKVEAILSHIADSNMPKASEYDGQKWEALNQIKTYQNDFKSLESEISSRLKQASALPLTQKEKAIIEINQALENKITRLAKSNYINRVELETITYGITSPKQKLAKVINYLENQLIKVGEYSLAEFRENSKLSNKTEQDSINALKTLNKQASKKNLENIQSLITAGVVSEKQAYKFASQGKTPQEMYLSVLKEAKNLYSNAVYTQNNLLSEANNNFGKVDSKEQRLASVHVKAVEAKINNLIQANLITIGEVNSIKATDPNKKLAKVLNAIENKVAVQTQTYSDTPYTQHIIRDKKPRTLLASAESVEKWVRQKMAEGNMGRDLDTLLQTKYASEVLDHYGEKIGSLRKAHEGLSGQVYVDAKAYDTPNGVTGCDQGALQHRANTIPAVLEMDKCSSCVFKNVDGVCQKYNKPIVASVELLGIDNPRKYQKESIRLANSSDSERTASLFANNYDHNEFSLTTNDELEIDDEQTPQALADVLFGGFEV